MNKNVVPKPILKWVGGKTQILSKLLTAFPKEMQNYHEVFLGGGSVLLALLTYQKMGLIKIKRNIYASDINAVLIGVYKNIQSNHIELYNHIQVLISNYSSCGNGEINRHPETEQQALVSKENYYYWIRNKYNSLAAGEKADVVGSAMFIFLNKTCFRGLFREGPRGFNVPYGNYKNPEVINREHLEEVHTLIQNVTFNACDFTHSLANVAENDFVYLDPPYAPENAKSFVGYTAGGFDIEKHKTLFGIINKLAVQQKKVMLSNADVELVKNSFIGEHFTRETILCKRAINSKNPESKTSEVLITNY
jgi:DNA adenine methylase